MRFSLRGTLPVLDVGGERIVDSTRIIAALERRWPDRPLYPADVRELERALELEDYFDEEAGHQLRQAGFYELRAHPAYVRALMTTGQSRATRAAFRLFAPVGQIYARRRYGLYHDDAQAARRKVALALERIESELQPSGYLVGDAFSVADLTAAALLFPFVWPSQLQYAYPDPPNLDLARTHAGRPALDWIAEMFRRHRGQSAAISG